MVVVSVIVSHCEISAAGGRSASGVSRDPLDVRDPCVMDG